MEQMEHRIFEVATRSIFVSAALRDRAVSRHAVPVHKTSVSMNAAEPVLDVPANGAGIPSTSSFLNWKRPVVGITGKITHRIDLGLIKKVAGLPEVGCVILIGGVSASVRRTDDFQAIVRSGKCIHLGERPQAELRIWHQLFDLALIPYVSSEFNYCCSPMRLFDYLAAQKEIVATDACAQVLEFRDVVDVAHDTSSFLELVSHRLRLGPDLNRLKTLRKLAEGNTWSSRAKELVKILNPC
jgi:glycosyltransferase involved in cell wall biosynthesis